MSLTLTNTLVSVKKKLRHFSVSLMRNIEKINDTDDDVIKNRLHVKWVKFAEAVIDRHKRKKSLDYHIPEIFPISPGGTSACKKDRGACHTS